MPIFVVVPDDNKMILTLPCGMKFHGREQLNKLKFKLHRKTCDTCNKVEYSPARVEKNIKKTNNPKSIYNQLVNEPFTNPEFNELGL